MSINMTQRFEFETDDLDSMRKMLDTIVPILFTKDEGKFIKIHLSKDDRHLFRDGSEYEKNEDGKWERTPATRVWLTTMSDYSSDVTEGDLVFDTRKEAVDVIMAMFGEADYNHDVVPAIGDGYDECFMDSDGHIDIGYRIHWEPSGGWNLLQVSLVHAYYGK